MKFYKGLEVHQKLSPLVQEKMKTQSKVLNINQETNLSLLILVEIVNLEKYQLPKVRHSHY